MTSSFSSFFREGLRQKYGRLPSAAFVAIQFSRQLDGGKSVSHETVRRWMRGISMPTYSHLQVLAVWLVLDINKLVADHGSVNLYQSQAQKSRYDEETIRLAELLSSLPSETQTLLLNLVSTPPTS
jgi:hypothetical protein